MLVANMNRNTPVIDFTPESVPMRRTGWMIYLSAVAVLLAWAGNTSLNGDEGDMAEGIRQLLCGNDIFSPQCWWQPAERSFLWFCRFRMLPAQLFGSSELICRLFSIISAVVLLCGTTMLAGDFFNRRTGVCAAWMLIGSYGFICWGRFAGSFMTLAAWVLWSVIWLRNARDHFWWRSVFFFLLFAGLSWWGFHYLLLIPGIMLITMTSARKALWCWNSLAAALFAGMVAAAVLFWQAGFPGVPPQEYPFRVWQQLKAVWAESFYIAVRPENGAWNLKSPVNLLRLTLPWSLPVVVAVSGMICRWRELSGDHRRLLGGVLLMIIAAGIFPGRRWQYQLSLLPFMLMLCAGTVTGCAGIESWSRNAGRVMWWCFCILGSLAVAVIVTWPLWKIIFHFSPPLLLMFGIPLLGLSALLFLVFDTGGGSAVERVSGMNGPWSGYILAGVCLMAAVFVVGVSGFDDYRSGRPFWEKCGKLSRHLPPHEILYYGAFPNAKHLYYMALTSRCTVVKEPGEFAGVLGKISSGEALLMLKRADFTAVREALSTAEWAWKDAKPLAVEAGAVNFYGDEFTDGDKYIICRIRRL